MTGAVWLAMDAMDNEWEQHTVSRRRDMLLGFWTRGPPRDLIDRCFSHHHKGSLLVGCTLRLLSPVSQLHDTTTATADIIPNLVSVALWRMVGTRKPHRGRGKTRTRTRTKKELNVNVHS